MSKAIAVFDMPRCCFACDFSSVYLGYCNLSHKPLEDTKCVRRPEWCLLKEVPENSVDYILGEDK